jgi:hypothetical protein
VVSIPGGVPPVDAVPWYDLVLVHDAADLQGDQGVERLERGGGYEPSGAPLGVVADVRISVQVV